MLKLENLNWFDESSGTQLVVDLSVAVVGWYFSNVANDMQAVQVCF